MDYAILTTGLICGGIGGAVRGFIGLNKSVAEYKKSPAISNEKTTDKYLVTLANILDLRYFILTVGESAAIGGGTALFLNTSDPSVLIPAGYCGIDAFEGLFKKR